MYKSLFALAAIAVCANAAFLQSHEAALPAEPAIESANEAAGLATWIAKGEKVEAKKNPNADALIASLPEAAEENIADAAM